MLIASILFTLEWWIDKDRRDRQAEIRRLQEQDEDDGDGGEPPEQYVVQMPARAQAAVHYRCRALPGLRLRRPGADLLPRVPRGHAGPRRLNGSRPAPAHPAPPDHAILRHFPCRAGENTLTPAKIT